MSLSTQPTRPLANLIYIFSSVPPDRPDYKRGLLNALCYPSGHRLQLNYRRDYFQPPLFQDRQQLIGRKAVLVFVDYGASDDGSDHKFTPIRFVRLLRVSPKEPASKYLDTTRVYVYVELEDFIRWSPSASDEIAALPGRPKPHKGTRDYFYFLAGPSKFRVDTELSQQDILDDTIQRLATAKSLSHCIYLSAGNIQRFKRQNNQCSLIPYGPDHKAYQLQTNNIYRVDLRVFDPKRTSGSRYKIGVRSSSDLIVVSQPFSIALGGPTDHSVLLACKRTLENTLATLEIEIKGIRTGVLEGEPEESSSLPTEVSAAEPVYLLEVSPVKWILPTFVVLIFLGFLLSNTSPEFFKEFDFVCYPHWWALACKTLGAMALGGAAYLAFRKLPSGGGGG